MKRRLLFVSVIALVLLSSTWSSYKTNVVHAVGNTDATVLIYCKQYNGSTIPSGAGYVKTTYSQFSKCMQKAIGVDAITVVMDKSTVDVVSLVKKLMLEKTCEQQTQDFSCIYGYSKKIRDYVVVDGQRVNIQIAVTDTQVHIGSPLLLGSY